MKNIYMIWSAIYMSPSSTCLLQKKCAEMKGTVWMSALLCKLSTMINYNMTNLYMQNWTLDIFKSIFILFNSGEFVKVVVTQIPDVTNCCHLLEAIETMKAPLKKLWEEHAFKKEVHELITNQRHFKTIEELLQPFRIITHSINKLRETNQPTIQHVLPIIYQLCSLEELESAKLAQYNNNFLFYITDKYALQHCITLKILARD